MKRNEQHVYHETVLLLKRDLQKCSPFINTRSFWQATPTLGMNWSLKNAEVADLKGDFLKCSFPFLSVL